jgi:hypothetical protein
MKVSGSRLASGESLGQQCRDLAGGYLSIAGGKRRPVRVQDRCRMLRMATVNRGGLGSERHASVYLSWKCGDFARSGEQAKFLQVEPALLEWSFGKQHQLRSTTDSTMEELPGTSTLNTCTQVWQQLKEHSKSD